MGAHNVSEEFEKHVKKMGGRDIFTDSWRQFEKDNVFFEKHHREWIKLYPDKWAAVFKEELICADADLNKILKIANEKASQPYTVVIKFLSTKKITFILNYQAAA